MLPPLMLAPREGAQVLDMCAAPGSKTGFLAQLAGPSGFVLGNEPGRDRLPTLRQNLRRLNLAQAATCSHPGEELPLPNGAWPFIQLDPPCSGWGTEEKNPNVKAIWTAEKAVTLVRLQRELLARAARLLAPGGRLLFSTCTTNEEENEAQVEWARDELGLVPLPLPEPPGFALETPRRGLSGVLRTDMSAGAGQGFFLALFTRDGAPGDGAADFDAAPDAPPETNEAPAAQSKGRKGRGRASREGGSLPGRRLDHAALACGQGVAPAWENLPPGEVWEFGGQAWFLPARALSLPAALRWQGFPLGKVAAGRFRPVPTCRLLLPPWTPGAGLDLTDPAELSALLSGRSLDRELDADGGAGLYFRGLPLGWLTRKGRRAVWSDR